MAIFKKQEKKNEKEEKDLQAEMKADKISLGDELLGSVAGGTFSPRSIGGHVGTSMIKNYGIDPPED